LNLELVWKPILVGGIFNTINPSVYESRSNPVKPKASYSRKDLNDWSLIRGITVNWPDVFPVNSVKAMRGVFFALERNKVSEYVELVFCSYWTNNLDISLDEVLVKIVEELGWSSDNFISFIDLESTKEALKLNTEELAKRGGFGSPTMFVDDENMFFGNDRLNLIEELLNR
jgi:2-hydroxychromene-2-carboxylate isomerase